HPHDDERAIQELIDLHKEWFVLENGRAQLAIGAHEFEFSSAYGRLMFSCWTEAGSRTWRIAAWNWTGEKLVLQARRRMGAEVATIELVPRASARALIETVTAARQARCDHLAQVVNEHLGGSSIERAILSPGMRRDQPGRYARIVLRLPHERIAVTATVADSDPRNVDSLFSSALLWFARVQTAPKRPPINRLVIVVERNILEAARQRQVLLRDSLRQRIELMEIGEDWRTVEPTTVWEPKYLWRKRLARFPPPLETSSSDRVHDIVAIAAGATDVVASRH